MSGLRVVVPVYRSERWIRRCIASIRRQTVADFRCIVVEDHSPDATWESLETAVGNDPRFEIVRNDERRFQLANRLEGIRRIATDPDDVVVLIDGDDWLLTDEAFARILREYDDPEVWCTYGSYRSRKRSWWRRLKPWRSPSTRPYSQRVLAQRSFREVRWWAGHPMTFRRFLFDQIDDADLRDDDGGYYRAATDQALFMPMMEMAGAAHLRHIPEPLYVWNKANPMSAAEAYRELQNHSTAHMRARQRYPLLSSVSGRSGS